MSYLTWRLTQISLLQQQKQATERTRVCVSILQEANSDETSAHNVSHDEATAI